MSHRPLFIVLEGIDGAGTTTQARCLAERLERMGRRAHVTREPSTGPVGRLLREILAGQHRGPDGAQVSGDAMALLFAADRRDHVDREIEPQLRNGFDVISDRYLLSSLAYQAEESDRTWVEGLARNVRAPDLTFLLDVPIEVAAERRRKAGRETERYDADQLLARIAHNYRTIARELPAVVHLDGSAAVEEVTGALVSALHERFSLREQPE